MPCLPTKALKGMLAGMLYNFDLQYILLQGSQIKIYDVDSGWKVQKNIYAKSLRWTITDTSLSPDQRHLVSSSI